MSEDLEEKTKKEEPKPKNKSRFPKWMWPVDLALAMVLGGAVINYYSPQVYTKKGRIEIYNKNVFKENVYYFANEDGTESIQTIERHLNVIYEGYNDPNNLGEFEHISVIFRKRKNPGFYLIPGEKKALDTKNYERWADKGRKYLKKYRQKYKDKIPFKKIQDRIKQ